MKKVSYAQNFEDVILWRALGNIKGGFYIDVGAAWPNNDSVTKMFYDNGWSGINIEPNTQFFSELVNQRPRDINLNVAIGQHNEIKDFCVVCNTGLSTLDLQMGSKYKKNNFEIANTVVRVRTLVTIFENYFLDSKDVHFLKIDSAGCENSVIKGNNWDRFRPWIVIVDAFYPLSRIQSHFLWEELLLSHRYIFAYADGLNRFYVAEEHSNLLSAFSLPPNVFDGFDFSKPLDMPIPLNNYSNSPKKKLLVDISMLMQIDVKTGIQRVVRAILSNWLIDFASDYNVEPIYASSEFTYRYASSYKAEILGTSCENNNEYEVKVNRDDIFIGLDLTQYVTLLQKEVLINWHNTGVKIYFIVYDILPIQFRLEWSQLHESWLRFVSQFDGLFCISKAVANDVKEWYSLNMEIPIDNDKIDWFHLGADIRSSLPSTGISDKENQTIKIISDNLSFLMVGTIEPRKGYDQVLDAFEVLWSEGRPYILTIIGRNGWNSKSTWDRINLHTELGIRLHFIEAASDEFLEQAYNNSDCLIAASYGEGFGLPVIEAAQHSLAVIARDIPVFREVGGNSVFYFNGLSAQNLISAINDWVNSYTNSKHPKFIDNTWLTWQDSARILADKILADASKN